MMADKHNTINEWIEMAAWCLFAAVSLHGAWVFQGSVKGGVAAAAIKSANDATDAMRKRFG